MTDSIDIGDFILLSLVAWAVVAYLIVPKLSKRYFRYHLSSAETARITRTSGGHPGDPINITLVASDADVVRGWQLPDGFRLTRSPSGAASGSLRTPCYAVPTRMPQ